MSTEKLILLGMISQMDHGDQEKIMECKRSLEKVLDEYGEGHGPIALALLGLEKQETK